MNVSTQHKKIILFANTAWYLYNFRLDLARHLTENGWDVVMMAPPDEYVPRLEELGFRVRVIAMNRRNLNPFTESLLVLTISKVLKQEAPDVIFNFTLKCVVYGSFAAKITGLQRRVNAVAGLGSVFSNPGFKARLLKWFMLPLLKIALSGSQSKLIVQNADDRALFCSFKLIHPDNLFLIKGSGVCKDRFKIKRCARAGNSKPMRILFASRFLKSKGIYLFVEAARELSQDPMFEFLLAGAPDRGNPESISDVELEQWSKAGILTSLGHVDNMAEQLADVDLVVLPSTYGEGVPRILIEAAAASLPLIAIDVPGSREIVLNNDNGYLLEKPDLSGLISSIQSIFQDERRYQGFCDRSRAHFLAEFELTAVLNKTLNVIDASNNSLTQQATSS